MKHVFLGFLGPIDAALGDIEDLLDEVLVGRGEVSGSGTGQTGSNVDLAINDDVSTEEITSIIEECCRSLKIPFPHTLKIETEP